MPDRTNGQMFVINRQVRKSRDAVVLQAAYVVVAKDMKYNGDDLSRGAVYALPDLHSVLTYNLQGMICSTNKLISVRNTPIASLS